MNAYASTQASDVVPTMRQRRWAQKTRDIVLCRRVIDETHDVKTFVLRSAAGRMFCFSAGLAARFPNVQVTLVCGQGGPAWTGSTGRIDGRMLLSLVPDLHKRTVFACGPEGYMKTARACLDAIGFPPAQYHEESFGGSNGSRSEMGLAISSSVRFVRSGVEHRCAPGETLLDAARNCGIYIPTACQQGVRGTCRIAKLSGEVTMDDLGGLNAKEKSAGYVLACCSRPRGTVLLDA